MRVVVSWQAVLLAVCARQFNPRTLDEPDVIMYFGCNHEHLLQIPYTMLPVESWLNSVNEEKYKIFDEQRMDNNPTHVGREYVDPDVRQTTDLLLQQIKEANIQGRVHWQNESLLSILQYMPPDAWLWTLPHLKLHPETSGWQRADTHRDYERANIKTSFYITYEVDKSGKHQSYTGTFGNFMKTVAESFDRCTVHARVPFIRQQQ